VSFDQETTARQFIFKVVFDCASPTVQTPTGHDQFDQTN
jgi:hypothetical protein